MTTQFYEFFLLYNLPTVIIKRLIFYQLELCIINFSELEFGSAC